MSKQIMKQEIEEWLGSKLKYDPLLFVEVYDRIFKPLMRTKHNLKIEVQNLNKIIEENNNNLTQYQSKIKQLETDIEQLSEQFEQSNTNYKTLEQVNTQTQSSLKRLQGSIHKMPKHVSLIQKHVDECMDGITLTELARQTQKSRSSIYLTVKWLVDNKHIIKQGTRYLGKQSIYRIALLDREL